jgi:hypothetical protein
VGRAATTDRRQDPAVARQAPAVGPGARPPPRRRRRGPDHPATRLPAPGVTRSAGRDALRGADSRGTTRSRTSSSARTARCWPSPPRDGPRRSASGTFKGLGFGRTWHGPTASTW